VTSDPARRRGGGRRGGAQRGGGRKSNVNVRFMSIQRRQPYVHVVPAAGDSETRPPLRVAYVLGTASGGTARHAGLLAEGCRRAGLAVLAAGPTSSRAAFTAGIASLPGEAPERPGRIAYHPAEISARPRPVRDLAVLAGLRALLRRADPDIVHAHGLRAGVFAALALAPRRGPGRPSRSPSRSSRSPGRPSHSPSRSSRAPGRPSRAPGRPSRSPGRLSRALGGLSRALGGPARSAPRPALVVTVHNAPPAGRAARAVYVVLELICARRADLLLCASEDLALRLRRRGAARVVEFDVPAPPAPVPSPAAVARARAVLGPPGRPAVLAIGRLAEQKGLDTLLAAARRWQDRVPVPVLAIVGEGPLAAELAARAARTGVDLALLGAADVIAVPSRWEARALVVQEAMAAGRPIVATRVGGIPALTGEDAAILVPPGDAGQLAAAVLAVLDDPRRAARLSAAARDRAATLPGPADAVAAVLAGYRSCLPRP
jgi:glycosyltransferase involved in cell wall biosynthesis